MSLRIKELASIAVAMGTGLFSSLSFGHGLPRPPVTLPLTLAQANQTATLDFEITEDTGYRFQIRFSKADERAARLQFLDQLPLTIWLELYQLDAETPTQLLAQKLELGKLYSYGEHDRSRSLGSIRLVPGRYRVKVKSLEVHQQLEGIDCKLLIPGRTFKFSAPEKQHPSVSMQALLNWLQQEKLLDHPDRLTSVSGHDWPDKRDFPELESYFIPGEPASFSSCSKRVLHDHASGRFWLIWVCGDTGGELRESKYTGLMPR